MPTQKDFSAQVDAWIAETEARIEAVFRLATQELFYAILRPVGDGGRMRVDTGFLRASFSTSVNAPVNLLLDNPSPRKKGDGDGVKFGFQTGPIALTINGAVLGDTIFGMFTANYARPREYGSRGKPGDGFVMTEVADWQGYVNRAADQVKSGAAPA